MEITPLGDSALIIRVCESFGDASDEAIKAVLRVQRWLDTARLPGVIETAPGYGTVTAFYDPFLVVAAGVKHNEILGWLSQRIRDVLSDPKPVREEEIRTRFIEIPVCYEGEFAPDLDEVSGRAGLTAPEVINLHSKSDYRVACLGFTPGFPYLTGLPAALATPRRAIPRKEIAPGSVAIGGHHTGIYPIKSPGGWHVIGRTPLKLFDPSENPPALLRAGDVVHFRAITRNEYEKSKR